MDRFHENGGGVDHRAIRDLADQLHEARQEIQRQSARIEELKASWSYRCSAPVRLVERVIASLRKRLGAARRCGAEASCREGLALTTRRREYNTWIDQYKSLSETDCQQILADIAGWQFRPLISVLINSAGSAANQLSVSVKSIRSQIYSEAEIVVACTRDCAGQFPQNCDTPIRMLHVHSRDTTELFNIALCAARGEYLIILNAGDALSPHALYLFARAALTRRDAALLYGDDDELHHDSRCNPFFKPDWDSELILSINYLGSSVAYLTDFLRKMQPKMILDTAWRWDLALRVTNMIGSNKICHIPFILCHLGSQSIRERNEIGGGCRIVAEEIARRGEKGKIEVGPFGLVVRRSLDEPPHVTVIVPTRDRCDLLRRCLGGLLHRTEYPSFDVLVVDNGSRERDTHTYLASLKNDHRVDILNFQKPFNFSEINNVAAKRARGTVLALLNNDVDVINGDWLFEMVSLAVKADVGAVGAKLYYPDNTIQHAGAILGMRGTVDHLFRGNLRSDPGPFNLASVTQEMSAVTGACLVTRRSVYLDVGGMDEFYAIELNDIDFCLRLRDRGFRVLFSPHAEMFHFECATRGAGPPSKAVLAERNRFRARRGVWFTQRTAIQS